jgi:hypothetical protein
MSWWKRWRHARARRHRERWLEHAEQCGAPNCARCIHGVLRGYKLPHFPLPANLPPHPSKQGKWSVGITDERGHAK